MSFTQSRNAIHKHIKDNWTSPLKLTFTNTLEKAPEFCRVTVLPSVSNQASMGAETKTSRVVGNLIIQCFVKAGEGTAKMDAVTDLIENILKYQVLRGDDWSLTFRSVVPNEIGQTMDNTKYQVNVVVQYYMDHI